MYVIPFLNPQSGPREVRRMLELEVVVAVAYERGDTTVDLLRLAAEAELRGEDSLAALKAHYDLPGGEDHEV